MHYSLAKQDMKEPNSIDYTNLEKGYLQLRRTLYKKLFTVLSSYYPFLTVLSTL